MEEAFISKGKLVSEQEWLAVLDSLKTSQDLKLDKAKSLLKQELISAVKKRADKQKKIGIAFSGGLDSGLIAFTCKKLGIDFTCYTVGVENAADLEQAKKVAKHFNFRLKTKTLSLEQAEAVIKKTANLLKTDNVVKVGVGSVFYSAAELAKKDNIKILFSGLGSEELFAGYERHRKADNINKECWLGLKTIYERDIIRDFTITRYFKLKLATPFLDKNLIKLAMAVPGNCKLNEKTDKLILRQTAEELGFSSFAYNKKRAAQYGSRFDKAIKKLAKRHGFKYKKEYLSTLI